MEKEIFCILKVKGTGSEDLDPHPDPYQNVTDPEYWWHEIFLDHSLLCMNTYDRGITCFGL
jgi:hypothetical protein